ncbi:DUF6889 family protein [Achromobacter xylosoxidans]|uniref:DUF6889 family protein n=1 Tax=Alcaligenes xylosoxydans xylosoxydans TaxID=85698 RepID=UPI000D7109C4|nr:hypothetical protein DDK21_23595 [Achromobacter xylosoxidans]PWY52818.1 hypothetical protein DK459_06490 [Achromobacter sp. RW408]
MKSLPGGEDWLLAPVLEGLCKYESLKDGTLDLADIALLNDALSVRADNKAEAYRRHVAEKNG